LKKALEGRDVNAKDMMGDCPLLVASRNNRMEIVDYLLEEAKADPNVQNGYGYDPLILAAGNDYLEICKALVKAKADVDTKDEHGYTAFIKAARYNALSCTKFLVEETKTDINTKKIDGETALHIATINGHIKLARYVACEAKADVNTKREDGDTPLTSAAYGGKLDMVKMLTLEAKADINLKGDDEKTAIQWAQEKKHTEIVDFLRQYQQTEILPKTIVEVLAEASLPTGYLKNFEDAKVTVQDLTTKSIDKLLQTVNLKPGHALKFRKYLREKLGSQETCPNP